MRSALPSGRYSRRLWSIRHPLRRTRCRLCWPSVEPAVIEVSVGKATVRIRGAVDARTLAAVLKALKVLK